MLNRNLFAKQLEPGLNTLFGMSYKQYPEQWRDIFEYNTSEKAFEEDVLLEGFGAAATKAEGTAISYDSASEVWTARYNHQTIALAFAITEEAEEDGLYGSIGKRYAKALARSMQHTKEIKAAAVLNNGFDSNYTGGDGVELFSTAHPTSNGDFRNELATSADFSEVALEAALIDISNMTDDRGIPAALTAKCLILPTALQFEAERVLKSSLRSGTAENDTNAMKSQGMFPDGVKINQRLTDTDAWFIKTDCPDGPKMFQRRPLKRGMEGDWETGNLRYKVSERYVFGWTDPRGMYASPGA